MLTDEMIEFIKSHEYWDRGINSYLSTNSMHFCPNIEVRTMNEENNPGTGLEIVESEVELREWRIVGENTLVEKINLVMVTDITTSEGNILESEVSIFRQDSQLSNNLESPMGSFVSLNSEQSSEREEDECNTPMTNWVKILKFEDTLTNEDHRQFKIMYESLLLGGKAGNLTKSTLEVVLAQKPPAWLQVILERLKHLIISSETFRNRRKRGYKAKRKMKSDKENRLWGNKKQKELHIGDLSNHWAKRKINQKQHYRYSRQLVLLISWSVSCWISVHVFQFKFALIKKIIIELAK